MADPFLILACALAAGIAASAYLAWSSLPWILASVAALFCAVLLWRRGRGTFVLLCLMVFCAGGLRHALEQGGIPPRLPVQGLEGRVLEMRPTRQGKVRYLLDHVRLQRDVLLKGKLALYSPDQGLEEGDVIRVDRRVVVRARGPRRNPGAWDWQTHARAQGIAGTVFLADGMAIETLAHRRFTGWEKIRRWLFARWQRSLATPADADDPTQATRVIRGMVLGDRADIDEAIQESFLATNTFHILAISGQQMTLIFLLLFGILRLANLSRRAAAMVCIPIMLAYASVVGWYPSVARSVTMMIFVLIGLSLDRPVRLLRVLALSAMLWLCLRPYELFQVGFQLSYLVVFGLVVFGKPLWEKASRLQAFLGEGHPRMRRALGYALATACASWIAWVFTVGLSAWCFQRLSLITLPANVLIVGWVSLITIPLGFVGVLAGTLWVPLAQPFHAFNALGTDLLIAMAHALASVPFASVHIPRPAAATVWCYYGALGLVAYGFLRPANRARRRWIALGLLTVGLLCELIFRARFECVFFDVGQGDAIFLRMPSGRNALIDAGGGGRYRRPFASTLMPYMRQLGTRRIDHAIMTHPHADHIGGLPDVLREAEVRELWGNGRPFGSFTYREVLRIADRKGIPLRMAHDPAQIFGGEEGTLEVLAPPSASVVALEGNENEHSVVLALRVGDKRILFAGDIERLGESRAMGSHPLRADILKVPHHGGATSAGASFLKKVRGPWAVISVGNGNRFGHPDPATLERLRAGGWRILRTDRDGAVVLRCFLGRFWSLRTVASRRFFTL